MLKIKKVSTSKDIKEFIELPLRLYKGNPHFVPPLYCDEKKLLKSGGNTNFAESAFFLAEKDGKTVGRLHAIIQKQYNEIHSCRQMRFTRFDSIDDKHVAHALFTAAENWGKEKGMNEICGPLGFSDLDREGLLVEGFEEDATFEEQYNFPYYAELIESYGFTKDADWLEYELKSPEEKNKTLSRITKRSMEMNKLHLGDTSLSKNDYIDKYRDGFFDCLDECYRELYGTVPITKEAQDELVSDFKLFINKEYAVFICDENERVVGFGLCFPSLTKALRFSKGKLTPKTLIKLIRAVRKPDAIDLGLVAVRPEYQRKAVNAILLEGILDTLAEGQVLKCETNLNLETNTAVQAQWKYFSSRQHKRRRSYIKTI